MNKFSREEKFSYDPARYSVMEGETEQALHRFYVIVNAINAMTAYHDELAKDGTLSAESLSMLTSFADNDGSCVVKVKALIACQILNKWHLPREEDKVINDVQDVQNEKAEDQIEEEINRPNRMAATYQQRTELLLREFNCIWQALLFTLGHAAKTNPVVLMELIQVAESTQWASLQWTCAKVLEQWRGMQTLPAYFYLKTAHNTNWSYVDDTHHYASLAATSLAYFYQKGKLFPHSDEYASHYHFNAACLNPDMAKSFLQLPPAPAQSITFSLQAALVCLSPAYRKVIPDKETRLKQAESYLLDITTQLEEDLTLEPYIRALQDKVYLKLAQTYKKLALQKGGEEAAGFFNKAVLYSTKISQQAIFYLTAFYEAAHLCYYSLNQQERAYAILQQASPQLLNAVNENETSPSELRFPQYIEQWHQTWREAAHQPALSSLQASHPFTHFFMAYNDKEIFMQQKCLPRIQLVKLEKIDVAQYEQPSQFVIQLRTLINEAEAKYGRYPNPDDLVDSTFLPTDLPLSKGLMRQRAIALLQLTLNLQKVELIELKDGSSVTIYDDTLIHQKVWETYQAIQAAREQEWFWNRLSTDEFFKELTTLLKGVEDRTISVHLTSETIKVATRIKLYRTQTQLTEKTEEANQLQQEVNTLSAEKNNLTYEKSDLTLRVEHLTKRLDELAMENHSLAHQLNELSGNFKKLMTLIEPLQDDSRTYRRIFGQKNLSFFPPCSNNNNIAPSQRDEDIYIHQFICPLTQDIMRDPVVAADGHTYERQAIEDLLLKTNISPITRLPFSDLSVRPNFVLKDQIENYLRATSNPPSN